MVELGYILMKLLHTSNLSIFFPHVFEFEVQANQSKPTLVGVIYRPNSHPRADHDLFMSKILEIHDKISIENKTAYLIGDYNINLLHFDSHKKLMASLTVQ